MKFLYKFVLILMIISPINAFAVSLNTESLILQDIDSGRVFFKKNETDQRLIASTTKIMTAIVAIENGNLEDIVTADEEVLKMYGSNIYIEYNEQMLLLDLIYGLMLRSGNDASVVIAKHISGNVNKFVKLMNKKAKELEMNNTIFNNPNGLDDETKNYSTAEDLAKLYSYAYKNETFKQIVGTNHYQTTSNLKAYDWYNRMKLLSLYDKATGGKTGYTPSAKRILVSSASNNDLDLVAVSFNSIYDYDLHINLYEEVFNTYKNYKLLDKNNFKYKNYINEELYIKEDFIYPLSIEEFNNIETKLIFNNKKDTGVVQVLLNDDLLKEIEVYKKTKKNNFFKKLFDKIKNL